MISSSRAEKRLLALALLAVTVAGGCGGAPPAVAPLPAAPRLDRQLALAIEAEALDSTSAAPYLDAIDRAVAAPQAEGALATVLASIDALAMGGPPTVGEVVEQAIAHRSGALYPLVVTRLERAWAAEATTRGAAARGADAYAPLFLRGAIARGLHELALAAGDEEAAALWATRRGCAQAAAVVGPLDAMPLRGLSAPSPIDALAPLAGSYEGVAPFAARLAPVTVRADACQLDLNAVSALQGVRAVVVDLVSTRAQTVGLALTSSSAAVLDAGGSRVLRRGFEAGGRPVTRLAALRVREGATRLVVRVGQKSDGNLVELDAWGDDGRPVTLRAPRVGDAAPGTPTGARAIEIEVMTAAPHDGPSLTIAAAGLLALGEARAAEHLLEASASAPARATSLAEDLLYARAVDLADDLPDAKITERVRGAVDHALAAAPTAWEAQLIHADLTQARRGSGEGVAEALAELGAGIDAGGAAFIEPLEPAIGDEDAPYDGPAAAGPAKGAPPRSDRVTLAYIALVASSAGLGDVADEAYAMLAGMAPGSAMLGDVDRAVHGRTGEAEVRAACEGGFRRADTACLDARIAMGDLPSILAEIERLRRLRTAPDALQTIEVGQRVAHGDTAGALAVYDAMHPAARMLLSAPALLGASSEARMRLDRDKTTARDAPYAVGALARITGALPDPSPAFEAEGKRLVDADRASAYLPGAAIAVLRHVERYDIAASGLLHFVYYDLRRVSGTTDVESGGQTYGPQIDGRIAPRLLRRRIHKRDGRVLEPDAAAHASQGGSDLSQLEQGDYVEHVVEGWALPGDSGQLVLDTPDLMPERASVRDAEIEIRRASSIPFMTWSHPLLGKADERVEGDARVSVWRLRDAAPRRIEDGVPRLERSVGVSIGTQTWAGVARGIDENLRSFEDRDAYVTRWAREAAGADGASPRVLIERIVTATGKAVKVGGGSELSDVAAAYGGGAQYTSARSILELGQGSRSWVIYRALRELGLDAEIAIAETEPWSLAPDFPPHVGRFRHPLVRVRTAEGDVWIDADVDGPPLPPGRISPELRGRQAMLASGAVVVATGAAGETGDEIDVRLVLDRQGDAKGTFTALLHGRTAQSLAEAFETVVGTDRREVLRAVVLGWLPWADVEDVSLSSSEGSWEVALRATVTIHGYGRPEGKDGKVMVLPGLEPVHGSYPRSFAGTLGASYAARGARQSALSIDQPLQYHVRRRVDLPAGFEVTRAPEGIRSVRSRLAAERKGTFTGGTLEEDFTLSLPTGTIDASSYQSFVDEVRAVDDAFMSGTRVRVAR